MRFIHTADWHLGRLFHSVHLTDDQRYVLDQFVDLVADVRPAAVLVAGDVYDRGVPPPEAVELLNDVLERIVRGLGVPVVMIAGNHDSPDAPRVRLPAPGDRGAAHRRPPARPAARSPCRSPTTTARCWCRPCRTPTRSSCATLLAEPDIPVQTHEQAMRALTARARAAVPAGARTVFVGHAFVAGAEVSDSERPLTVGGAGTVPASVFAGFDYVALGHLHRPQAAGAEAVRYAGFAAHLLVQRGRPAQVGEHRRDRRARQRRSGLARRRGEARRRRPPASPAAARVTVEQVELRPRRRVRVIEGTLRELLERAPADEARDDYVCARLLDKGALLNAMGQLQQAYPNCLHLEFPSARARRRPAAGARRSGSRRSEGEHFAAFFELRHRRTALGRRARRLRAVLERLERRWRES